MIKPANFVYSLLFYILKFIGVTFSVLLFWGALLFSSSDTDITTLKTFVTADNLLPGLAGIFVFLGITSLLYILYKKNPAKTVRLLLFVTLAVYAIGGTLLIIFAKSAPQSDSFFIYEIASNCAKNDFKGISTDSYLSIYPHQIGLVFFYEPLLRFWNMTGLHTEGYIFLQFVNLLLVLTLIYFLYKLTEKLFHGTFATVCCLVLALSCFPLYFYVLRVYGDIPSLAFLVVGLWTFTVLLSPNNSSGTQSGKAIKRWLSRFLLYLLNIVCFFLSVATRKNSIIALIALIIITLLFILHKKRWSLLFLICSYLLLALFTLPLIQTFYETRAESTLDEGTPPIAYIAMGMQNAPKACGWYNGFNYNTYVESGHNLQFVNGYSKKRIEDRLTFFKENPTEAFHFYFEKYTSQWCDGSYASRELTAYTPTDRSAFFTNFYSKDGGKLFLFFCNCYQTILFWGVMLFCLNGFLAKKENLLLPYTLILIAFGGFLFHFLWEANARAIFPYTFLLLPLSGSGIAGALSKIWSCIPAKLFTKNL